MGVTLVTKPVGQLDQQLHPLFGLLSIEGHWVGGVGGWWGQRETAGKQIKGVRGVSVFASPGRHKSLHNNSDTAAQGPRDNTAILSMSPVVERGALRLTHMHTQHQGQSNRECRELLTTY